MTVATLRNNVAFLIYLSIDEEGNKERADIALVTALRELRALALHGSPSKGNAAPELPGAGVPGRREVGGNTVEVCKRRRRAYGSSRRKTHGSPNESCLAPISDRIP